MTRCGSLDASESVAIDLAQIGALTYHTSDYNFSACGERGIRTKIFESNGAVPIKFMATSARWIVRAALSVALVASGADCVGMLTPDQAMRCCNTMHCHSHSHQRHMSQDCCNTMSRMSAALGQAPSVCQLSFAAVAHGPVEAFRDSEAIAFSYHTVAEHSHDPPSHLSSIASSLRI